VQHMSTKDAEDDGDIDVVALARETARKASRAATARGETGPGGRGRRAAPEEAEVHGRNVVEGIPQGLVDAAVEQMVAAGVSVDMRRIKLIDEKRIEVDLTSKRNRF
jgi:hypothetical protein